MDPQYRQAFTLWTQAQPAVSAFVHALVGDRTARDEVLQEVALAILENFERYDTSRPFLPLAIGVARKKVANGYRSGSRWPGCLSDAAAMALADAIVAVADEERAQLVIPN